MGHQGRYGSVQAAIGLSLGMQPTVCDTPHPCLAGARKQIYFDPTQVCAGLGFQQHTSSCPSMRTLLLSHLLPSYNLHCARGLVV
jgi:hypothetical protein